MDRGPSEAQEGKERKARSLREHERLLGMVILSVAFIIGSFSVASGVRSRNQPPRTDQVTVTGSAEEAVTSDEFQWDASVASTKPTTSGALSQLEQWASLVRATLEKAGARGSEVSFGSVVVQPNTNGNGFVASFTESQTITVRSDRIPSIEHVLMAGNQLLGADVPFIAQEAQYTYTNLKKLRPLLTGQATADARRRAAAALGPNGHLGKPISISVGPFSVDAPGSVNIGSGDYDTSSVPKVVSVAVTATYSTSS